jgi:UbiD family decarboxylase
MGSLTRKALRKLQKHGELTRVQTPANPDLEIPRLAREEFQKPDGKALLF